MSFESIPIGTRVGGSAPEEQVEEGAPWILTAGAPVLAGDFQACAWLPLPEPFSSALPFPPLTRPAPSTFTCLQGLLLLQQRHLLGQVVHLVFELLKHLRCHSV